MSTKYNIDINELEQLLDMMYSYVGDEDIDNDIELLKLLINRLKNNFSNESDFSLMEKMARDASLLKDYESLFEYNKRLLTTGMYFPDAVDPDYQRINITHDDALNICMDFYRNQGNFFSSRLEEFYKEKDDRLMFFKPNGKSEGEIHFFKTTGDAFVLIPDYKNIKKVSIMIHEFEHVIDSFSNPNFYKNQIIREVGSMFMELIGCDYIAKKIKSSDDALCRRFQIASIVKANANSTPHKKDVLNFTLKHRYTKEDNLLKRLNKEFDYSEDFINFLFDSNLAEDFYYQIPYMIAVELYQIYLLDKDKALYILIDLITNGNDLNFFDILGKYNIVLGENMVKYEDDLCLKLDI